ncbi:hypothetical protein ACQ3JU_0360 (plasmid) [Bradyrhizobium guangxiense]
MAALPTLYLRSQRINARRPAGALDNVYPRDNERTHTSTASFVANHASAQLDIGKIRRSSQTGVDMARVPALTSSSTATAHPLRRMASWCGAATGYFDRDPSWRLGALYRRGRDLGDLTRPSLYLEPLNPKHRVRVPWQHFISTVVPQVVLEQPHPIYAPEQLVPHRERGRAEDTPRDGFVRLIRQRLSGLRRRKRMQDVCFAHSVFTADRHQSRLVTNVLCLRPMCSEQLAREVGTLAFGGAVEEPGGRHWIRHSSCGRQRNVQHLGESGDVGQDVRRLQRSFHVRAKPHDLDDCNTQSKRPPIDLAPVASREEFYACRSQIGIRGNEIKIEVDIAHGRHLSGIPEPQKLIKLLV